MRTSRLAPLAAVLAVLGVALAGPAQATHKPKPVCNLLVDKQGDAGPLLGAGGPLPSAVQDPSLDIVSADLVADKTRLVAVIRVAKLTDASQQNPLGRLWTLRFELNGQTYAFQLDTSNLAGPRVPDGTGYTGVLVPAQNLIRFSASWSDLYRKPQPAVGSRIGNLTADASSVIYNPAGVGGTYLTYPGGQWDAASSTTTYSIGTPSCVPLKP